MKKKTEDILVADKITCEYEEDGKVCGENIENEHYQYRSMGFCQKHYNQNGDDLWEEFLMTREACR